MVNYHYLFILLPSDFRDPVDCLLINIRVHLPCRKSHHSNPNATEDYNTLANHLLDIVDEVNNEGGQLHLNGFLFVCVKFFCQWKKVTETDKFVEKKL